MNVSRNLLQSIVRLNKASSKEEIRAHICGVHVLGSVTDGALNWSLQATDGYKLARYSETQKDSTLPNGTYFDAFIEKSEIKKLDLFLKSLPKYAQEIEFLPQGQKLTLKCLGEDMVLKLSDLEFPNTKRLLVDKESRPFTIGLNPELLWDLFEAMSTSKRDSTIKLSFDPSNPVASILVQVGDNSGILMPKKV